MNIEEREEEGSAKDMKQNCTWSGVWGSRLGEGSVFKCDQSGDIQAIFGHARDEWKSYESYVQSGSMQ